MDLPPVQFETPLYQVNITAVLSVLIACLTAATAAIRIWGKKQNTEEMAGNSPHCKQQKENLDLRVLHKTMLP